jgi:hypothetical protein
MKRGLVFIFLILLVITLSNFVNSATYYISPAGSDGNNGLTEGAPRKTFLNAFGNMSGGDELVLLDGNYSVAAGTGVINYLGTGSGQPPSGDSASNTTYVHAKNIGEVKVIGGLFLGRSTRKDRYITIEGITFENETSVTGNAGSLYNTEYIIVRKCGFHSTTHSAGSAFSQGTNDASSTIVNSNNLIEDVWIWGNERIGLNIYRSNSTIVRRAVVRNDGCYSSVLGCGNNAGNQMVGTTIYNSHNISFQNIISIDNVMGPNGYAGAGDFYIAYHDNFIYPWYGNEWFGTISLNSNLSTGYGYDIDNLAADLQPMATYKDIVAVNVTSPFNAQMNCGSGCSVHNISIDGATLYATKGTGLRIDPSSMANSIVSIKNIIVIGNGSYGLNPSVVPSYVDVNGTWMTATYRQNPCVTGCLTTDPLNVSLKYLTRIENGSALKGTGSGGADYGANVIYQYGTNGTFYGETGFNTLTSNNLWPWPYETRIKKEMCTDVGETRGFCSSSNLTTYIWEYLGNTIPADIYGSATAYAGDINSDDKVDSSDILLIIRWILGISQSNSATDMNGNSVVDIFDLVNDSRLFGKQYGTDSTVPTITSSSPSSNLSAGTTSAILFAKTDERATCKYATFSSGNYSVNMTNFTRTGRVSHSINLTGLVDGTLYNYYIQCQDETGNLNSTNYLLGFGVNS